MDNPDIIIVMAYLLCIAYFLYRIVDAFNDEMTIRADNDALSQKLAEKNLQDTIGISFGFDKRYEFDSIKQIAINISNKSDSYSIYVDWDCSVLTDLGGRSRRVTRLTPGTTLDLFQSQVSSTIAPKTTLKENITAEDLLERKGDAGEFKISKPLIDPSTLKKNARFMKQYTELDFALEIALRLVGSDRRLGGDQIHIPCKLTLKKLPWTAGLPWNPKKKKDTKK